MLESQKHMDNNMQMSMDQATRYISMSTKFEEFILIHGSRNAEQGPSFLALKLLRQGTKS